MRFAQIIFHISDIYEERDFIRHLTDSDTYDEPTSVVTMMESFLALENADENLVSSFVWDPIHDIFDEEFIGNEHDVPGEQDAIILPGNRRNNPVLARDVTENDTI